MISFDRLEKSRPERRSLGWMRWIVLVACVAPLSSSCGKTCKSNADCPSNQECLPLDTDSMSETCCPSTSQVGGTCCTQDCPGTGVGCNPPCTGGDVCLPTTPGGSVSECCSAEFNCGGTCCFTTCSGGVCES
jgi:hypothetical protein